VYSRGCEVLQWNHETGGQKMTKKVEAEGSFGGTLIDLFESRWNPVGPRDC
jgi:hypothetical protein